LDNNIKIVVNVALDAFSTNCWINESLIERLGAKTVKQDLYLTTMACKNLKTPTLILNNLKICDLDETVTATVPVLYSKRGRDWPFSKEDLPRREDLEGLPFLDSIPFRFLDEEVSVLIGMDMPGLLKTQQTVSREWNEPFASRHWLGWALNGPISPKTRKEVSVHRTKIHFKENEINENFKKMFLQDYDTTGEDAVCNSVEDDMFLEIVTANSKKDDDNHYVIDLPLKANAKFPNNRNQALERFKGIEKKFTRNNNYFAEYSAFMNTMMNLNFAEEIPPHERPGVEGKTWYLVHHGVYHKQKNKLRVVFDCSLQYGGTSLNDNLLQGPDMTNSLIGVLLRFRQDKVALTADIEKMFYQVRVPPEHSDFMRFFWYGAVGELSEFRLKVHVFGARSSPSVANFALRLAARDGKSQSEKSKDIVDRNFYVDDLLVSYPDEKEAVASLLDLRSLLAQGSFNLTSFAGTSKKVLSALPEDSLSNALTADSLASQALPESMALGVTWNTENDSLGYRVVAVKFPATRRGVLRTIASIYDPLGLAGPVVVPAKAIFQETCRLKLNWDDELPPALLSAWNAWQTDIRALSEWLVPRCLHLSSDGRRAQLHVFCDGSEIAYGAVAYARVETGSSIIVSSPIMAKSRLTPLNNSALKTIPRIELCAAKLSVSLQLILRGSLDFKFQKIVYWTDSTTVIKYLSNDSARFQRFVANKVAFIRSHSYPDQWRHVPTKCNPADILSRGSSVRSLIKCELWQYGPKFLRDPEATWPALTVTCGALADDPEVRKDAIALVTTPLQATPMDKLLASTSSWFKLSVRVAWLLRLKAKLFSRSSVSAPGLTSDELRAAELEIFKRMQITYFTPEISAIQKGQTVPKSSALRKLTPFLDESGVLRLRGRIENSAVSHATKHPILLPGKSHLAEMLVMKIHSDLGHMGRETVLSYVRTRYWIVGGNALFRKVLLNCVACRKRQGRPLGQVMANLPAERVTAELPAFTNTGVDYFGPFFVTRGRTQQKRYGVIFSCLSSRAIHIEVAHSLTTDSFIHALRRFISRRGNLKSLRSDNGTNFVGAHRELLKEIDQWNKNSIEKWLLQKAITWTFNPPFASHFGGVWEREIRTIRKVLAALTNEQPLKFNDEEFGTLMCEVEAILNNRPLTPVSDNPEDLEALTPNHLLLLNAGVTFPPGLFCKSDACSKKRWKQVQYLADLFWTRWRREYLTLLQTRQKWTTDRRSVQPGDLVLVSDNQLPRNQWPLGRIVDVKPGDDARVRVAKIKVAKFKDSSIHKIGCIIIERPIHKLILLREGSQDVNLNGI
jgi:transposase InsO family protein